MLRLVFLYIPPPYFRAPLPLYPYSNARRSVYFCAASGIDPHVMRELCPRVTTFPPTPLAPQLPTPYTTSMDSASTPLGSPSMEGPSPDFLASHGLAQPVPAPLPPSPAEHSAQALPAVGGSYGTPAGADWNPRVGKNGWVNQKGERIKKVNYTHDALIDAIIENPTASQGDLAVLFGYTQAWISQVMSSDAFRMRMDQRKAELVDPHLRLTIEEKFRALTQRSLDILQEKLSQNAVDPALALKAAELGAKALGIGSQASVVRVDVTTAGDKLDRLADRLRALMPGPTPQPQGVIDVQARPA